MDAQCLQPISVFSDSQNILADGTMVIFHIAKGNVSDMNSTICLRKVSEARSPFPFHVWVRTFPRHAAPLE